MKTFRLRGVIGAGAAVAFGCASTFGAQAQTVTLKFATFGSEKSAVNACGPAGVITEMTKQTNGRIKFTRFFAGTAFSHPLKQYSQIARGVTDMDMVCVDPWSGGSFDVPEEKGRHLCHTFAWVR